MIIKLKLHSPTRCKEHLTIPPELLNNLSEAHCTMHYSHMSYDIM